MQPSNSHHVTRYVAAIWATLVFGAMSPQIAADDKEPPEAEQFLSMIEKEGIGDRMLINVGGAELGAEERKLGMPHQNTTPNWRVKLKSVGNKGEYVGTGGVPIAFNPRTGKVVNGLPLGRGTVFEVSGKGQMVWTMGGS
ncbi:MAG: hypothetical protein H8E44_06445 [Planctomycetes bacterium]|nr:hypothetical protein [Planctomycetota bacterium]MBL7039350.1 hypothetical protein [Pirellulaceae bacterium]